jgi:ankyrin repeat protein
MSQPLPEPPDLRQLRRQAKELCDSARAGGTGALGRIASSVAPRDPAAVTLAIAQLTIAREHGFPSWPKLKAAVDARAGGRSPHVSALLTACVTGRTREAARLLAGDPQIGHASVFAAAVLGEAGLVGEFIATDLTLAVGLDDDRGWPPLLYTCYSHWHRIDSGRAAGLTTVASLLLDAGASPATTNGRRAGHGRRSALAGSVAVNNPAITRLLLDRGAPADDGDALYQAATYPDCACLELLLSHGAAVASNWAVDAAAGARNTSGLRLLLDAAARAEPGEVAALATRALSPAADNGPAEAVEALLGAGADPDVPDPDDGLTPLQRAIRGGHQAAAAALASHGARDEVTDADRLLGACMRADRTDVERLVAAHPGLAERLTAEEPGVLTGAAGRAPADAVRLLVGLGFPPDARNHWGETALHTAAYAGRADTVQYLLSLGAELDARDERFDGTPLAYATVGSGESTDRQRDWPATVRVLLDAGASHEEVWLAGKPPSGEVAEVLRQYGVQPDSEPGPGEGGQRPQPDSGPDSGPAGPPAPDLMREIAEQLTEAYHSLDMELLASLLDPAVQWGSSGPDGCHTREQVLAWYAAAAHGTRASVTSAEVTGDTIVLTVALTSPADDTRPLPPQHVRQAFKVSGGAITQITGLPVSSPD